MTKSGKEDDLFDLFYQTLEESGLIAHKGQIVDASFVEPPKQPKKRDEKKQIKEGHVPEEWDKKKTALK